MANVISVSKSIKARISKYAKGYVHDEKAIEEAVSLLRNPVMAYCNSEIRGSGKGQKALLYRYLRAAAKDPRGFPYVLQGNIGTCVGASYKFGVDCLRAIRMLRSQHAYPYVAGASIEIIYGGSRVEIGMNGRGAPFGGRDGSNGSWAVRWLMKYGIVLMLKHQVEGKVFDLTEYSVPRAREYGKYGCPDPLEAVAKEFPVQTASILGGWEELRDGMAGAGGVPVIATSWLPTDKRDGQGFAKMYYSPREGHAQVVMAMDDSNSRPGALIVNTWPLNWISGPKKFGDEPEGSYWVDAETFDKICKERDTWILNDTGVWKPRELPDLSKIVI